MSQYQRQRKSEADFQKGVEDYYEAKEAYDELVATMPFMPSDQRDAGDKGKNDLQSATDQSGQKAQTKATAQDHKAAPGLVMADNLPEAASKEELQKRAAELNKK